MQTGLHNNNLQEMTICGNYSKTPIVSETHTNWQWITENLGSVQGKYKTLQGNSSQTRKSILAEKSSNIHTATNYQHISYATKQIWEQQGEAAL